ncbi:tyrosine-type recombinase/integrase [Dactylosporangium sucinum]|uniref:Tyrosine recombinase XerC n=1 Tax=Dactylosporangium sucinum TaxID=1424081 RepID=A0A917TTU8_9ACTN|nr:tyrosine-type recombinase/integrase [Dactylosporangium sucinum]GGM37905.1 tyrosine recombinase XerC [Dactylosporangium sucinum]
MSTLSPLPPPSGGLADFTEGWLANRRLSAHTRAAYRRDVHQFLAWCAERGVDPVAASFLHVNAYGRDLESTVDGRTGRPLAPASVARKLSALSSWYQFLVRLEVVSNNPVGGVDRPRVARDVSSTVGLSAGEVDAMLAAAARLSGPTADRDRAVLALLADLGLRVGEVVALDLGDVGVERGHRTVRFTGKGGLPRRRALTPAAAHAIDTFLARRGDEPGPLFTTATGGRVDRHAVFRLVRRLARDAGVPAWERLSPHSLRHAFATAARDEGVPLEDVQDAMGHADPRTTRRYDRDRHNLDRDPAYALAAARARRGHTSSS